MPHTQHAVMPEINGNATSPHGFEAETTEPHKARQSDVVDPIVVGLLEKPPKFDTPSADTISGYENEADVKQWAANMAMSDPKLGCQESLGKSTLEENALSIRRLTARQSRIEARIASEPDQVREPVLKDDYLGIGITPLFAKTRYYIPLGVAGALSIAGLILAVEFNFEVAAAINSSWGFAQTLWGARGLVFSATFGAFITLTGWSAVEKYPVHWSVKTVGRIGAILSVAAIGVISFALGNTHVPDGQYFGWPMLMIPLGAGVLICGAFLAKEFAIWVGKMAFPMHWVKNQTLDALWLELEEVDQSLKILQKQNANAKELIDHVHAIRDEFVGRVYALWLKVKKYESTLRRAQERRRQQVLANAEAELAERELNELVRPE